MSGLGRPQQLTALSLALAGLLFIAFPLFRPWGDKDGMSEAEDAAAADTFASTGWVVSHTFGMFAFILVALAFWGLRAHFSNTATAPWLGAGAATSLLGAGMVLPYFGMETFGLHVLANSVEASQAAAMAEDMRQDSVAITMFGLGLILLALGAIAIAVAISRLGTINRWSAYVMAAGITLYLPQFFFPPFARVSHGVLLGLALLWMAYSGWQEKTSSASETAAKPS